MYIHAYKDEWKVEYLRESELIRSRYGADIELHHIGSTAVIGLYAKDCIDILGVVSNLSEVVARKDAIVGLGYRYKGAYGIEGREYFSKDVRKVHFHIFASGDSNIEKHLKFVETMKGDQAFIDELNRLKIHLHSRYPHDREAYQKAKKFFYTKIHEQI
jgi:GrpB-like predicted nucleotidyltransferase (UPF0157 family)